MITDFSERLSDDINGTLTIIDASPTVSNSSFDNSIAIVDMIIIDGDSSPIFDHIHIKEAHCAWLRHSTDNYYSSGGALIDPSCFQIGTQDEHPADAPNPAAGPAGL